ncbi:MAG TPA: NADH-quinone oxidoreductase subunit C [Polyangiaceae bacterium]
MTVLGIATPDPVKELLTRFGATLVEDGPPLIEGAQHRALARALRDELGYRVFGFVIASHHPNNAGNAQEDRIRVAYGLRSIGTGTSLAVWQVEVRTDEAIPSLVQLFAGADWQEREQYDLFGVAFEGHPDLRRLMLPEDWNGHPLRKDYAIDTQVHPWR